MKGFHFCKHNFCAYFLNNAVPQIPTYLYQCPLSESRKFPAHVYLLCFRSDLVAYPVQIRRNGPNTLSRPTILTTTDALLDGDWFFLYPQPTPHVSLPKHSSREVVICCLYVCFPWRQAIALCSPVFRTWNLVWINPWLHKGIGQCIGCPSPGSWAIFAFKSWILWYCYHINRPFYLRIYTGEKSGRVNLETILLTCDRGRNTERSGPAASYFLFVLNSALSWMSPYPNICVYLSKAHQGYLKLLPLTAV